MIIYHPDPMQLLDGQNSEKTWTLPIPSGGHIEVADAGSGQLRVVRLCSTNPNDYLEEQYQPGTHIELMVKIQ